jgi:VWFA-related protein
MPACRLVPRAGLAALCALLLPGAAGTVPPAPSTPGQFVETTEVLSVQVPVQVVRRGEPVRGLTAANFEIYDGRRKQALTGFEVLDLGALQGPAAGVVPPALRRHFLFLFDLSFSEPKSIVKARQMVAGMLPLLHPSDLVAVASYSSANGPRLLLGFTSDRRQVLRALDRLGLPQLVDRNPDPLSLWLLDIKQAMRGGEALDLHEGTDPLPALVRLWERMSRAEQADVVRSFATAVADFAGVLASVHGRKQVIFLSEGFDASLLQGTDDPKEKDRFRDLVIGGRGYEVDSDERYGTTRSANLLERMMELFRRSDCVVQAVDLAGVHPARPEGGTGFGEAPVRPAGEGSLFVMAHDTGGELYRNFNDLGEAMARLLKRTTVTYVLAFQPDAIEHDGRYHPLRVRLKGAAARGAQAFFRQGYYSPKPYAQWTATEKSMAAAEAVMGGNDGGRIAVAVLVAPFWRRGVVKAYVPVVIETEGAGLLGGSQGESLPVEIYVYAVDSAGRIQDFFTQFMRLDLARLAPALRRSGLKFVGHLDLPAGDYGVRVLVRNGLTGDYGLRAEPLAVPAPEATTPVLLPPFFLERPGRWVMVRETPREPLDPPREPPPYPFVVQRRAFVPASRPVLAAGREAMVELVGYHLPAGALEAHARVLTAGGEDLGQADFKIVQRESPAQAEESSGEDRLTAVFRPPPGLKPGEYRLVVGVTDARGVTHDSVIRFMVPAETGGGTG